jgi:uroporphyrin-III C-methyltransferase/precorrin-2 dehydrogenase/sirohydrochlorin ferrochelatase
MADFLPLFLTLAGRDVVLVGGGRVAAAKLQALLEAGARVRVVAPAVGAEMERPGVEVHRREFVPEDLDGAWLVVAAATPAVNRQVAAAAEPRRMFVNAVDDPANASAFLSGTVRRGGVTIAISTSGEAPGLTSLLREALDAVLPDDLGRWMAVARAERRIWRRDHVPMAQRKPQLLAALNALYDGSQLTTHNSELTTQTAEFTTRSDAGSTASGHVSLVGAGPGDPTLLTRRAIARLRAADLVLYDALIDDRILRYARKAQRFFVGKRGARELRTGESRRLEAMSQQTIHTVMIRAARRGRRVVRLKGGDPFLFGRGGEEAMALARAGIAFDVVPGVTSAIAAPGLAGIPVTYRGVSSGMAVISGHEASAFSRALEGLEPNSMTLVVLMGGGRGAAIAAALVERGWRPGTAAAVVVNASLACQQVWRGTLAELARHVPDWTASDAAGTQGPATIIVGEVVALAADAPALEREYVTGT